MSTCNRLDLHTLGSPPVMPQKSSRHCSTQLGLVRLLTLIGHLLLSGGWSCANRRTDTRKTRVCKELGWVLLNLLVILGTVNKQPFIVNKGEGSYLVFLWFVVNHDIVDHH